MPELPEVETIRKGVRSAILGRTITQAQQNRPDLRVPFPDNLEQRLTGRTVKECRRRSKYLLIDLDNDDVLIVHFGMSGRIIVVRPDETYEAQKHDHLLMVFDDGTHVAYNDPRRFGMVMMTTANDLDVHKSFHHLGPEPLGNEFNESYLVETLANKNAIIKTALLDQTCIAGLGNIYVSEALFYAGIDPRRVSSSLNEKEISLLVPAIKKVLRAAIEAGGSTLKDYRHADGDMGYFQHQFAVYDKKGHPCPDCSCQAINKESSGTKACEAGIIKIQQAGRATYYCPHKQK